ncbi:uncharacterized protein LOC142774605 isoform X1 [Rhipicephalus microplus]|uniref:uncharacterized protein LOC142774605 isoform X1 n=1 Tax=Rhipicephalus microplus TaxID=6941 RepID=UPI003F6B5E7F
MVLITDKGTVFIANQARVILRCGSISHRWTTAYHPHTNCSRKWLDETITDMLAMDVNAEHKTWDAILPHATFAYNTAVQETTQVMPYKLVYGRSVEFYQVLRYFRETLLHAPGLRTRNLPPILPARGLPWRAPR